MRVLVLEDMQTRIEWFRQALIGNVVDFVVCVADAKILLAKNNYDMIFLDHDLRDVHYGDINAEPEETGYAAVQWMISEKNNKQAKVIIHSMSSGAPRMETALKLAGYDAQRVVYHDLQKRLVNNER